MPTTRSFSFGPFTLAPERQLLLRHDARVRVGGRALELLLAMVEQPGELLTKETLLARAWPNTTVEESNLKVNIAALRRTLGETAGDDRYIATVPGRGYRFVAPVQVTSTSPEPHDTPVSLQPRHNLPISSTRIVGRTTPVEAVSRQLQAARLVTLVGAGGIGKTAVAIVVAERAVMDHEHGVWFVDLAFVADPVLVPGAIAAAVGLRVHSGDVHTALSAFLKDRRLLLVLDNCEHVIDAAATIAAEIVAGAADVRVLATSREPLRARGEHVYRLAPLETPPKSIGLTAAAAMSFPAVELFVERAAASGSYNLTDADAPVVADICKKLDGLALAIELAATRTDAFDPQTLLGLLDDRFRFLQGQRSSPERHQTLRATLDWSYDLLPERERTLLRRLAVFAGPFTLASAQAVADDIAANNTSTAVELANLVAKSLVTAEPGAGATHYRLLDTTRSYALQKLAAGGELDTLHRRHAMHLRDLIERAEAEWGTLPTAQWITNYGRKLDDVRSALQWAFAADQSPALGVALTVAAIPLWEHLSLVDECRASIERALDARYGAPRSERDAMKLCSALGTALLHTRGPLPAAKSAWTTALQLAEQLDDVDYQLRSLWGLCDYHTWIGDHRTALAIAGKIRAVALAHGDNDAGTNVDRQVGTALRYLGELGESREHLERMIARYVPPVVRSDIARFQLDPRSAARGTLTNVLWLQGYPEQAARTAQHQLANAYAADHALALCNALVHATCPLALWVGELDHAEHLLALIDDHIEQHAMVIWRWMAQCLRGEWLLQSGDPAGLPLLRRALDQLFETGFRMRSPAHLGALAEGYAAHGGLTEARATIEEAIDLSSSSGELWCMPELLRIRGGVLRRDPTPHAQRAAEQQYQRAIARARDQGALAWELRATIDLAELHQQAGAAEHATHLLTPVYARFTEGWGTRDVRRARALLDVLCQAGPSTG
ncbi:MAG: winged helix-turn-helix domain-containing protein [Polyangiales bacterium]